MRQFLMLAPSGGEFENVSSCVENISSCDSGQGPSEEGEQHGCPLCHPPPTTPPLNIASPLPPRSRDKTDASIVTDSDRKIFTTFHPAKHQQQIRNLTGSAVQRRSPTTHHAKCLNTAISCRPATDERVFDDNPSSNYMVCSSDALRRRRDNLEWPARKPVHCANLVVECSKTNAPAVPAKRQNTAYQANLTKAPNQGGTPAKSVMKPRSRSRSQERKPKPVSPVPSSHCDSDVPTDDASSTSGSFMMDLTLQKSPSVNTVLNECPQY